jgi:hypothetical protein
VARSNSSTRLAIILVHPIIFITIMTGCTNSSDVNLEDGQTRGLKVSQRRGIGRKELLEEQTKSSFLFAREGEET